MIPYGPVNKRMHVLITLSGKDRNMRLLDNVRLVESEVLAPPTASVFECLITKLASCKHSDYFCNSS